MSSGSWIACGRDFPEKFEQLVREDSYEVYCLKVYSWGGHANRSIEIIIMAEKI